MTTPRINSGWLALVSLSAYVCALPLQARDASVYYKRMNNTFYTDDKAMTHAIALIESGDNTYARGDLRDPDGPALGAYQIHQHAWDTISDMRRAQNLPVHPYHSATDKHIADSYALSFTRAIIREFTKHFGAPPSPSMLYACYSLGPSILPRIIKMKGLTLAYSPYCHNMMAPIVGMETTPLYSVGYSTTLSKRKMATGNRYENLLTAHHQSLRETGIPLL